MLKTFPTLKDITKRETSPRDTFPPLIGGRVGQVSLSRGDFPEISAGKSREGLGKVSALTACPPVCDSCKSACVFSAKSHPPQTSMPQQVSYSLSTCYGTPLKRLFSPLVPLAGRLSLHAVLLVTLTPPKPSPLCLENPQEGPMGGLNARTVHAPSL